MTVTIRPVSCKIATTSSIAPNFKPCAHIRTLNLGHIRYRHQYHFASVSIPASGIAGGRAGLKVDALIKRTELFKRFRNRISFIVEYFDLFKLEVYQYGSTSENEQKRDFRGRQQASRFTSHTLLMSYVEADALVEVISHRT